MIEWSGEYYLLATEAYKYKLDNRTERKLTTRSSECGAVIFISHIIFLLHPLLSVPPARLPPSSPLPRCPPPGSGTGGCALTHH